MHGDKDFVHAFNGDIFCLLMGMGHQFLLMKKGESKKKENVFLHTCIRVHKFINLNFISYIFEKLFPNTITLLGMISLSNLVCNFLLTILFRIFVQEHFNEIVMMTLKVSFMIN